MLALVHAMLQEAVLGSNGTCNVRGSSVVKHWYMQHYGSNVSIGICNVRGSRVVKHWYM